MKLQVLKSMIAPSISLCEDLAVFFQEKNQTTYSCFSESDSLGQQIGPSHISQHAVKWSEFRPLSLEGSLLELNRVKSGSPADPCPPRFFKILASWFNLLLNSIWNSSLKEGIYPASWKTAFVQPILKKLDADPAELKNFRPISLLSAPAKVLEKEVQKQLAEFLESNKLLHDSQSGFRSGYSTETALLEVSEIIRETIDQGNCAMLVLLDLSAAFDTVSHQILLDRLELLGVMATVLSWFRSFLEDCSQKVFLRLHVSSASPLVCGVPQGSALSPTLFNVYLAPLAPIIEQFGVKVVSYADDTQLVFSFREHTEAAFTKFKQCMRRVVTRMTDSCMKLNTEKTEVLFFNESSSPRSELWWPAELNPPPLPATSARTLGFKLDTNLSGNSQICHVSSSCFWKLKAMRRFLHLLPMDCRKSVVHALVISQLDYVNSLYLGLPDYLIRKLQIIQNAAARLIRNVPLRHHITPHLWSLHWLPIKRRLEFKALTVAYRATRDMGPKYLKQRFLKYHQTRTLWSNNQDFWVIPRFAKVRIGGRAFSVKTAALWNAMPEHLRKARSEPEFRKALKPWLFERT